MHQGSRQTVRLVVQPRPSRPLATAVHGMAALTVVMGIFFVLALVAAYTNRNLVFEQRMSINSYRAERAVAAADGGIDWALSMLNGGRIDAACQPTTDLGQSDFRTRYLTLDQPTGSYAIKGVGVNPIFPGCVAPPHNATPSLTCICPSLDNPTLSIVTPDGDTPTAFRISFSRLSGATLTPPGTVMLIARGCSSAGNGATACTGRQANSLVEADGMSLLRTNVGLVRALPTAPVAALTAGSAASATGGLTVINPDPATGVTIHTGQGLTMGGTTVLRGPPGSAADGVVANDTELLKLIKPGGVLKFDLFFKSMLGMNETLYKTQPAAVRVNCAGGACKLADLEAVNWITGFPGRTIFVDGDLLLDTAPLNPVLGSPAQPLMLVVNGKLTLTAAVNVIGFIYAQNIVWSGAAATATVQGSVVAAERFDADVPVTISFDPQVMEIIARSYGSFVRVPGGWNRGS